ncbi:11257_t:CDS:10 [Entrophospora sp. SA101]|nr:11257_t:CDS:10 [Entrophospora sp. SA101]
MNYSTIQFAREELSKYENDYQEKAEEILDKVSAVRFSGSEIVLYEEKERLIEKYRAILRKLGEEKETILRQIEKKVMFVTPLRQKDVKQGYCYFCDISIAAGFPYKLKFEEQKTLEIEVTEGAVFCSQECLLGYCREYKNREKLCQEEEKRNKEKIENDRKKLTEIQERITELTEKINSLERKERELELVPENNPVGKEEVGFFRRLGQKIGLVKKPNPLSKIERVRKLKGEVRVELEKTGEEFQKCLIILSLDEQKEQERKKLEENVFLKKEKIASKKELKTDEENDICQKLTENNYLAKIHKEEKSKNITVEIKYAKEGSRIHQIKKISKPSQHIHVRATEIKKNCRQRGLYLISTSQGLLTQREALEKKQGKTLQEYLNWKYPTREEREQVKEVDIDKINESNDLTKRLDGGEVDLSEYVNLEKISINGKYYLDSPLTKLTLGEKPKLTRIYCRENKITSIDMPNCPNLTELDCFNNQLTTLDLSDHLKEGKRNYFYGSLKSFQNLTKLESICIEATDVNEGLEYLPLSLAELTKGGDYKKIECLEKNIAIGNKILEQEYQPKETKEQGTQTDLNNLELEQQKTIQELEEKVKELMIEKNRTSEKLIIPPEIKITQEERKLLTASPNTSLAGTYNSLITNMIKGVAEGFQKTLEVKGVGYKVALKNNQLEFNLGKSHLSYVNIPDDLKVAVEGNKIIIKGLDKQKVNRFAANDIRPLRQPSIYKKSKGIYYLGEEETIKLRASKSLSKNESNRYLRVQAIDDKIGHTLIYSSTEELTEKNNYSRKNKDYAQKLAEMFADKLKKENKEKIVFDRNGRPYHEEEKYYKNLASEQKNVLIKETNQPIGEVIKEIPIITDQEKKPTADNLDPKTNRKFRDKEKRSFSRYRFQKETLQTKRVVKVTKGGRRFSFTSLVLIKDEEKKGVAFARAGGKEVISALQKATRKAEKKLLNYFPTPSRTIPCDILVSYKATKLFLKPAPPGNGIKAGGILSKLFKYLEIKDVSIKIIGSRNKLNVIRAAFLALDKLTVSVGKKKKIVGRGIGSGRGKTCGRGQKGQHARKSGHVRPGFEGGQTPVFRRFPKRGFKTPQLSYQVVNLARLEKDEKIINGQTIDFSHDKHPTKILGEGKLTKQLTVKAAAFSHTAQAKITQVACLASLLGLGLYLAGRHKIPFPDQWLIKNIRFLDLGNMKRDYLVRTKIDLTKTEEFFNLFNVDYSQEVSQVIAEEKSAKLILVNYPHNEKQFTSLREELTKQDKNINNIILINIANYELILSIQNEYLICPLCEKIYSRQETVKEDEKFICPLDDKYQFSLAEITKFNEYIMNYYLENTKILISKFLAKSQSSATAIAQLSIQKKEEIFNGEIPKKLLKIINDIK